MSDLKLYGVLNSPSSYSGGQLENSDDASRIGQPEVEVDIVHSPATDSAGEVFTALRENKLTILISRLMEGDDSEALRRDYSSELVEDAISVLENRI